MNKTLLARPQVLNVYTKSVSAGDRDRASGWFVCLSGAKATLLITHTRYPRPVRALELTKGGPTRGFRKPVAALPQSALSPPNSSSLSVSFLNAHIS